MALKESGFREADPSGLAWVTFGNLTRRKISKIFGACQNDRYGLRAVLEELWQTDFIDPPGCETEHRQ